MKLAISMWGYYDPETNMEVAPKTATQLMSVFRDQRDVLLKESDWCVGVDSPLNESVKQEWINWRQSMRDFTDGLVISDNQEWVKIPEPPIVGKPKTWVNLEFDFLSEQRAKLIKTLNKTEIPPAPIF